MPSNLKFFRPLLLVLSFFLLLGLYTKLIGPVELRVNQTSTQKAATFDVTGEGSATVIPDQAEVTLGITTTAPTVATAQQQTNQILHQLNKIIIQTLIQIPQNLKFHHLIKQIQHNFNQPNQLNMPTTISTN